LMMQTPEPQQRLSVLNLNSFLDWFLAYFLAYFWWIQDQQS